MLYVGTHKGSEDDGYVCSSKPMLEEYSLRSDDFSRKIIAKGLYDDMISLENAILKSVNARKDPYFYNMHNGDGKFYNKGHTEAAKLKISIKNKGNKRPDLRLRNLTDNPSKRPEVRAKLCGPKDSIKGELNPMWGKNHTEESKRKMSINRMGKGKQPKSEHTKKLMSEARKLYWAKRKTS